MSGTSGTTGTSGTSAISKGVFHTQGTAGTSWTVNHNLNNLMPIVQVYDSSNKMIIPGEIILTNANTATITFPTAQTGKVVVVNGDGNVNGTSGTTGTSGTSGIGFPGGGTSGQILVKNSTTSGDASWITPATPVYLSVNKNSNQSISHNSETTITNWDGTFVNNTPSAWNATTGVWTCPVAGTYDISLTLILSQVNPDAVAREFAPIISFNGTPYIADWFSTYTGVVCNTPSVTSRYVLQLAVGDVIRPRVYQDIRSGTAYNIVLGRNSFIIKQLPSKLL
jgi:hypothetical protein